MRTGSKSWCLKIGVVFLVLVAFGGMAFTLGLLRLSFPLSTLSYLKFDLAEIPPIIAVLMFGKAFWFSY